ncbi:hypothetical protein [Clostridium magnum]|uniref:Uncharacterized protein n=1 Tax=Clostridium magnum DSM 2767 TaxID=1121326 RepID=A0A162TJI8_9CLOT|nr:hypothetical protein [Clostridium magnum]KZL92725.1 hypothetical protein CLMAG_25390 [Clostridium magnum DSM 2767]SHI24776.1 hypothetical protein SAMN02745944_03594 [Clostridium magnum DSM 2767]
MTKNQKLGLIILTSSLIVLVLLLIPSTIKDKAVEAKRNEISQKAKEIESKKAEVKKGVSSADDVVINQILGDFTAAINKKDFDKAYSMLDQAYTKDFDLSKDTFKDRYNFANEKKLVIENTDSKHSDRWVVELVFQDTNAPKDKGMVRKTFTIYKKGEGKYVLADVGILVENTVNKKQQVAPGVTFTLEKMYVQPNGSIAIITVENKTKVYFTMQNGRFAFYAKEGTDTYEHRLVGNLSEDYIITPGIPKKFIVQFKQVKVPDIIGIYYKGRDNTNTESDGIKSDIFNLK